MRAGREFPANWGQAGGEAGPGRGEEAALRALAPVAVEKARDLRATLDDAQVLRPRVVGG